MYSSILMFQSWNRNGSRNQASIPIIPEKQAIARCSFMQRMAFGFSRKVKLCRTLAVKELLVCMFVNSQQPVIWFL